MAASSSTSRHSHANNGIPSGATVATATSMGTAMSKGSSNDLSNVTRAIEKCMEDVWKCSIIVEEARGSASNATSGSNTNISGHGSNTTGGPMTSMASDNASHFHKQMYALIGHHPLPVGPFQPISIVHV
jgi:hypothetical protein